MRMGRLVREPLFQCLLGGLLLFGLHVLIRGDTNGSADRVVVPEGRVVALASAFERTWMRPPTPTELEGLVDELVTEEILYREALSLGLDRDDVVVRRRLRQKMEFLLQDEAEAVVGPSSDEPFPESELRAELERASARFAIPPRTSFEQLFVDPQRQPEAGKSADARATALLTHLRAAGGGDAAGDATLLPGRLTAATPDEVDAIFGEGFAAALAEVVPGEWTGPLRSTYGLHLVRVAAREPGRMPALEEVRDELVLQLSRARTKARRRALERAVRDRYEVEIHLPAEPAAATSEP